MVQKLEIPEDLGDLCERYIELNRAAIIETGVLDSIDPDLTVRKHNNIARHRLEYRETLLAKIEQLDGNPLLGLRGLASEETYRESPRTLGKTAQDMFVDPPDRMLTTREPGSTNLELDHMIVSTGRINDNSLRTLGLEEWILKGRHPKHERMAHYREAIPAIRARFTELKPIRLQDEEYDDIEKLKYFRLLVTPEGELLVTKLEGGDAKIFQRTNLHAMERRFAHIEKNYKKEANRLDVIKRKLTNVHKLLADWLQKNAEEIRRLNDEIVEVIDDLEFVKDEDKVTMRERLKTALNFLDSLGRPNPTVSRTKIITVLLKDMTARQRTMRGVAKTHGYDRAVLAELIASQEGPLIEFVEKVEEYNDHKKGLRVFRDQAMTEEDKAKVVDSLEKQRSYMADINLEPHASFARCFLAQIDKTLEAIQSDENIPEEFIKLYFIAKLKRAHHDLMQIYKEISINGSPDAKSIHRQIERAYETLGQHQTHADLKTYAFLEVFVEYYELCRTLMNEVSKLFIGDPEKPERGGKNVYEEMKKTINKFPFAEHANPDPVAS